MKVKHLLIVIIIFFPLNVFCSNINLLPRPQNINYNSEYFKIGNINVCNDILSEVIEDFIVEMGGKKDASSTRKLEVRIVPSISGVKINIDEAYRLTVKHKYILIEAYSEKGVYWALQTLRQLKDGKRFVGCEITDWPAFRVRGFMQDVGRTYISLDELKREISRLSEYKINVFHWHLTENQAWRMESKVYPELNDSVNMTRLPGKFYTHKQARELVEFCRKHNVMLIPEIDMPGHSEAFLRAFNCSMQSEKGIRILESLLTEICEVFKDVPYLHIGTDEVEFTNANFVPQMVSFVRSKGKKVISWNPGWDYKKGEIDMTQLWSYRGKAQKGIPAVDSRFHYMNHFDNFADIIALYTSRICNAEQGSDDIAGCIMALWHDRFIENEWNIIAENNFYPSMLAMAERSWCRGGYQYFDCNGTILPEDKLEVIKEFADFERRMIWHKKNRFMNYPFIYVRQCDVKWLITNPVDNKGNLDMDFDYMALPAKEVVGAGIYLRHVWGKLIPSFVKEPKENSTCYAYTYVYSPKRQRVGLWAEFQNYSRSEKDLPPQKGTWDYKGSRIWLNDEEVLPPLWTSNHKVKSNEILLGNENMAARKPIPVFLDKGWNKVVLKLPIGKFTTPEVRLQKWMFAAVFVDLNGEDVPYGLIYSPTKIK